MQICAYYATLLHRYTSECVVREIMVEQNMANLIVAITKEERKDLKQIALDKDMTVSALWCEWPKKHQEKEGYYQCLVIAI